MINPSVKFKIRIWIGKGQLIVVYPKGEINDFIIYIPFFQSCFIVKIYIAVGDVSPNYPFKKSLQVPLFNCQETFDNRFESNRLTDTNNQSSIEYSRSHRKERYMCL